MPGLADTYLRAAHELRGVVHDDADWSVLRLQLVGVLAAAGGQVLEAAEAVSVAVEEYAAADLGAAGEFRRLRGDSGLPG